MNKNKSFLLTLVVLIMLNSGASAYDLAIATSPTNSIELNLLQKICSAMIKISKRNILCKVLIDGSLEEKKYTLKPTNNYSFIVLPADAFYHRNFDMATVKKRLKTNFVTQLYRRTAYLLASPTSKIEKIQDLKGKKVNIFSREAFDTFKKVLRGNNLKFNDVKLVERKAQLSWYDNTCNTEVDAIFHVGLPDNTVAYYFVEACGYKLIPIKLTPELKKQYPYYKSTKIITSNREETHEGENDTISSITVPIVALSSANTSNYIVAFFLKTFFEDLVSKNKIFQNIKGQALDYMKNATSLPVHSAAKKIKLEELLSKEKN